MRIYSDMINEINIFFYIFFYSFVKYIPVILPYIGVYPFVSSVTHSFSLFLPSFPFPLSLSLHSFHFPLSLTLPPSFLPSPSLSLCLFLALPLYLFPPLLCFSALHIFSLVLLLLVSPSFYPPHLSFPIPYLSSDHKGERRIEWE